MKAFKTFLGPLASPYTDAELAQLYQEMHEMAKLLLDLYRERQSSGLLRKD